MTKSNINPLGVPKERIERIKGRQHIEEITAENVPELKEDECSS